VRDAGDLKTFKKVMEPAWRHTLQIYQVPTSVQCRAESARESGDYAGATLKITRSEGGPVIRATYWAPSTRSKAATKVVVLCSGNVASAAADAEAQPVDLTLSLLQHGFAVLRVDRFSTGATPNQFTNFFSTYNRTEVQERVRDLLTACAAARSGADPHGRRFREVVLWGSGRAGLWALLAAPGAGSVIADCNQLDVASDEALLAPDLFCPGIRNIGTFEGAAMLAAPHPVLMHNTGAAFTTGAVRSTYQALGASGKLRLAAASLPDEELVSWVAQAKR
jgi:hypothetical protein